VAPYVHKVLLCAAPLEIKSSPSLLEAVIDVENRDHGFITSLSHNECLVRTLIKCCSLLPLYHCSMAPMWSLTKPSFTTMQGTQFFHFISLTLYSLVDVNVGIFVGTTPNTHLDRHCSSYVNQSFFQSISIT